MWGVPITHEYFNDTNTVQWLWYYHQDTKDHEESHIRNRNIAEYHASFIEPELVGEVMKQRDEAQSKEPNEGIIGTDDDAVFNKSLEQLFGRDPNLEVRKTSSQEVHKVDNLLGRIENYEQQQEEIKNKPIYNYKHWTDFNLE